jgi:hypothetical protein
MVAPPARKDSYLDEFCWLFSSSSQSLLLSFCWLLFIFTFSTCQELNRDTLATDWCVCESWRSYASPASEFGWAAEWTSLIAALDFDEALENGEAPIEERGRVIDLVGSFF